MQSLPSFPVPLNARADTSYCARGKIAGLVPLRAPLGDCLLG